MSRPTNYNHRENTNNKTSFATSGLATNLPPAADVGRRGGDSENGWRSNNTEPIESGNSAGKYRPPRVEGRGEGRGESTWGTATTTYARRQKQEDPVEDVEDKWSKVFNKSARPAPASASAPRDQPPAAELPINSRAGGFGRGFGDGNDAPERPARTFADRAPQDALDRPPREGRDFGERPSRDFSDRRDFGDRPPREGRDFSDRPPREGRDFSDRPPREGRDFGGRPPREGYSDRQPRDGFSDRGPRDYNDRQPRERRDQRDFGGEGKRNFGEGDARRPYNGGGRNNRDRGGDREWENDPRFASKFGRDLNPRFNDREKAWEGPLPTAPKASLDAGKVVAQAPPIAIFKEKVVAQKQSKNEKNDEEATDKKNGKRKAEEEAKKAKLEAEVRVKEEESNKLDITYSAVAEGIKAGLRGEELTTTARSTSGISLSPAGALKAVLNNVEDYTTKWYDNTRFGHVLKSSLTISGEGQVKLEEQVSLLYIVQDYCASRKFPKIDIKGVPKKLIEILITHLLAAEFVDPEGIIAWADDISDNDYPGRADAIVQTTGLIATLRESLIDEESEVDSDEDFDAPQAHLK